MVKRVTGTTGLPLSASGRRPVGVRSVSRHSDADARCQGDLPQSAPGKALTGWGGSWPSAQ